VFSSEVPKDLWVTAVSRSIPITSRPDEVNGKVHETLALTMDGDMAITCKLWHF